MANSNQLSLAPSKPIVDPIRPVEDSSRILKVAPTAESEPTSKVGLDPAVSQEQTNLQDNILSLANTVLLDEMLSDDIGYADVIPDNQLILLQS